MDKQLIQILSGGLGFFWRLESASVGELADDHALRGFIRRIEEAVEVHVLNEDPLNSFGQDDPDIPYGVLAVTEHTGAMLLDVSGQRSSLNIGGSRASVTRFTGSTLIVHPRIAETESARIYSLSGYFRGNGLLAWADLDAIERSFTRDAQGRLQGAEIKLRPTDDRMLNLTSSTDLRLSSHWDFSEDEELQHVVRTSLEITVASSRPKEFRSFLIPLLRCQELLSLSFRGFLPARGGRVGLVKLEDRGHLWNAPLMPDRPPPRVPVAAVNERPLIHLSDIGGFEGVGRWIRLCRKHPRAVRPVVNTYRLGPASDASRLLEVAAAIEYWVARHRRKGAWTKKGENPAEAVAGHVGNSFTDWCGDARKWGEEFWRHYNGLKHDPQFDPDPFAVKAFQESGYLLLVTDLLNRVGRSTRPAKRIFADYRNENLRGLVREVIGK